MSQFAGDNTEDDDMKIAPESMSEALASEDSGESVRQELAEQQEKGNVDLAKELGEKYALTLMSLVDTSGEMSSLLREQVVLFSFAVNKVIEELAINSIVAQTALSCFYQQLESKGGSLYDTISDSIAFSLYISATKGLRAGGTIGGVFAKLLQKGNDPQTVSLGNALFADYYARCSKLLQDIPFRL